MISRLVNSTVDDRPLTDDELYQLGFLLYLVGLDTIANVLTYSFRFLAGRPDLRSLLRDEPDKNSARRGGVPALVLHRVDRATAHSFPTRTSSGSTGSPTRTWPSARDRTAAPARTWPGSS